VVNRKIGIALLVAVVIVAYPAAAWLIGLTAEHQWEQREQEVSARYPYFKVVKHEYHRGVYSATEEVTYRLTGRFAKSMQSLPGSPQEGDLQFTIRNTIHHGPLPQLQAFAPATVDSEIILPPQVQQKLAAAFDNKAHITIHTTQHWLGSSTTVVHSNAFTQQMGDAATATWRGLDATTDVGADLKYLKVNLTAPGLEIQGSKGSARLEDMRIQSDQQLAFDGLYVGSGSFTLAHLELAPQVAERKVSLANVVVNGKSSAQGEYIDFDSKIDAASLQVKQFDLTRLGFEIRGSHWYGPAMAALNKSLQQAQADSPDAVPDVAKMMEPLKTSAMDMLVRDPVLEIPRIGFAMPEGELLVSLKASAHGLTRAELDGPPIMLRAAMGKHLQISADVRIDTALLDRLLDSSGQSDRITGQLQGLQRQGYIKLEGKTLSTHLTFEGGQVKVNGLSFPPLPGAMPQPPPGGHP
jgi:uncharacterized protein YdgA (DUF945 family)